MNEGGKDTWKNQSGYIWSMLGSAVGFANILGFSAKAYFHGGGAFIIPFLAALLTLGIPLLFLEGIIGQQFQLPLVASYARIAGTKGRFFGWLAILAVITIGAFYTVLTGCSVAYTYFTAANLIPPNTASFFKHDFLHDSGSLTSLGSFVMPLFFWTALVGIFSWLVMSRDIQSGVERVCSLFLPLLFVLVFVCAAIACFLPGASIGFYNYLKPDFRVLANPHLWLDSFGHLFFSLSLGLGIVTGYSRHADATIDIRRSMLWVTLGDFIISFVAGLAIFGCIGYMSTIHNVPFVALVKSESSFELGFVVFPMILRTFGTLVYSFLGPIFFFSVFIAGVTGVFSIVESIAGNIEVEFHKTRQTAVTITIALIVAIATLFCFGNGQHIIGALEKMVTGFNMLIGGIAEIIVFLLLTKSISNNPIWFSHGRRTKFYYCLRYVSIGILATIFVGACIEEYQAGFGYPAAVRWGWFVLASIIAFLLARNHKELKESR